MTQGQGQLFAAGDRRVARVRRSVDAQIAAQRALGQIEPVDGGLVGVVRTMADTIDAVISDPEGSPFVVITGLSKLAPLLLELRGERHDGSGGGIDIELEVLAGAVRDALRSRPPDPS